MAEVTLQVKVLREQVDKLQSDIEKLRNTKIDISAREMTQNLKEAQGAISSVNGELSKTIRVFDANGDLQKGVDEFQDGIATTVRVTSKLNEETGQLEKTQTRVTHNIAKEQKEAAKAQEDHADEVKKTNEEVKKQGILYDILGRSVSDFILRMTAYRAVYAGIRAITNGFKEALDTLKAVDDELVTVRKVTGFDPAQMAQVEEQAYAVASKYGSSAADYVSGVAAFARAGYKELSGDLAELAEKTQIVGDTTAEVAQQFLLSVDAAYKYKGNVEELQKVLDGANEIDNKYATSIEKIAEGMGIVAPVAAQMHVGVDELAASIGTITAVTQRTGTETARALRALFLNIVGDTKTEIDEGVTWTTGEIEGLRDVIKIYAKDAYDAAEAMGSIIDPMEAMKGLSQSLKDGLLTEQELMQMVSDIGGKLRTSQLLALINNWDMYESMLNDYRNAYGSADKEIENAMDSWSRKANVLKNTWTEFVKTSLNSDLFKGLLDFLTNIVERLGTLTGTVARLAPFLAAIKLKEMAKDIKNAAESSSLLVKWFDKLGVSSTGLNIAAGAVAALGVAWSVYSYIVEDAKRKHEELVAGIYEEADAAKDSSENIMTLYADFNSATEGSDALTEAAQKLAEALGTDIPEGAEAARKALQDLTMEELNRSLDKLNAARNTAQQEFITSASENAPYGTFWGNSGDNAQVNQLWRDLLNNGRYYSEPNEMGTRNFLAKDLETLKEYRAEIENIIAVTEELARTTGDNDLLNTDYYQWAKEYINETAEAFEKMNSAAADYDYAELQKKLLEYTNTIKVDSVEAYERLIQTIQLKNRSSDEERDALIALAEQYYPQYTQKVNEADEAATNHTESVKNETDALFANQDALDENASASDRVAAAKRDAEAAVRDFIPALFDEENELTEAGKAALIASDYLADLTKAELEARQEAAQANYASLRAQLAGVATDALKAAYALIALETAYLETNQIDMNEARRLQNKAGNAYDILRQIEKLEAEMSSISVQSTKVASYGTQSSSSSKSSSSYSKSKSSYSGSSGGSYSKSRSSNPNYSSSSGRSSSSSSGSRSIYSGSSGSYGSTEDAKLEALQDRISLLKSELALMQERGDSEEDLIAKMREIQQALLNEENYLKSIKGDQTTINGLAKEWWQYENQISDMMEKQASDAEKQAEALQKAVDAQIALNNAMKDRSVRYYNAQTGQWEWGANQQNIDSARSARDSAIAAAGFNDLNEWGLYLSVLAAQGLKGSLGGMTHPPGIGAWDAPMLPRGSVTTNTGVNNYGSTYNFQGITLTEDQARGTSVYELARLSRGLVLHNSTY